LPISPCFDALRPLPWGAFRPQPLNHRGGGLHFRSRASGCANTPPPERVDQPLEKYTGPGIRRLHHNDRRSPKYEKRSAISKTFFPSIQSSANKFLNAIHHHSRVLRPYRRNDLLFHRVFYHRVFGHHPLQAFYHHIPSSGVET